MAYRINGFDQIKAFYSIVFEQKYDIKPHHISLYVFLINQNNRNNWVEWFKCPFDLAMAGACIGNKKTYYKCLSDLQEWKLIKYEKGINDYKAPKIKLEVLICTTDDTATVPQSEPLLLPQGTPQGTHIYKPKTKKQKIENKDTCFSFNEFWELYDKKVGKPNALKLFEKITEHERELIKKYIPKYKISKPEVKYRKDPERFLKNKVWEDEIIIDEKNDNMFIKPIQPITGEFSMQL